ncbi:MAG: hypothetical protein KC636_38540, partial [Myxococcales bacterium]|nr:hypothetical protein [Myxococcales bacterium]
MVVSDLFRRRKAESLRAQALRALHHQEFARAEALLVHSRALDPSVRGVHVGLARALQAQGKVVEAARALAE